MDPTSAAILGGFQLVRLIIEAMERRERGAMSSEELAALLTAMRLKLRETDRRLDELIAELEAEQQPTEPA